MTSIMARENPDKEAVAENYTTSSVREKDSTPKSVISLSLRQKA